jgi:hypothetical protein
MKFQRLLLKISLVALLVVVGSLISARADPDPVCPLTTNVTTVRAAKHPVWDPSYENAGTSTFQRWRKTAYETALEEATNETEHETALKALIGDYYNLPEAKLRERITADRGGANTNEGRNKNALATYNLALLFHITGDERAGFRAAWLLDEYAKQFPKWTYRVCSRGPEELPNGEIEVCGIWSNLFHSDMAVSSYLALAFDLLAPPGVLERLVEPPGAEARVRQLLVDIVKADFKYRLYVGNKSAFYRPLGIVIFGRVLDDPELVHLGYWYYSKLWHENYMRDGFEFEGSYSYHRQMTRLLADGDLHSFYMDGYSTPLGYCHEPFKYSDNRQDRWDRARIENFSWSALYGEAATRMLDIQNNTGLPNGSYPVINDTTYPTSGIGPAERSMLLGGIGHAILVNRESPAPDSQVRRDSQARLDFSHTVSHAHRDALHLIYFDQGIESVGGTGYEPVFGGIDGRQYIPSKAWNMSTFTQNLVAIDEKEQNEAFFHDWTEAPYVPEQVFRFDEVTGLPRGRVNEETGLPRRLNRQLWDSNTNHHNNVVLWQPGFAGFEDVQVVEVDATDAYRGLADRYQRMLVLVRLPGGGSYLADVFRMRGGTQYYDWLLHGGHHNNTLTLRQRNGQELCPDDATCPPSSPSLPRTHSDNDLRKGGHITFKAEALTAEQWYARFDYPDDNFYHDVWMPARAGTKVIKGEGPRYYPQHENELQDHLVVRRSASPTEEVVFLAVHETHKVSDSAKVVGVEELSFVGAAGSAVGMRISLASGDEDYLIYTLDDGPAYSSHKVAGTPIELRGRFAHVRVKQGHAHWMYLVHGALLDAFGERLQSPSGDYSRRGSLLQVLRRETGSAKNAFLLDQRLSTLFKGSTLRVTWGNGWNWAYPIEGLERNGQLAVTLDEPGFELVRGQVDQQYFPQQEFCGLEFYPCPVTYVVPGVAVRDPSGTIATTETSTIKRELSCGEVIEPVLGGSNAPVGASVKLCNWPLDRLIREDLISVFPLERLCWLVSSALGCPGCDAGLRPPFEVLFYNLRGMQVYLVDPKGRRLVAEGKGIKDDGAVLSFTPGLVDAGAPILTPELYLVIVPKTLLRPKILKKVTPGKAPRWRTLEVGLKVKR